MRRRYRPEQMDRPDLHRGELEGDLCNLETLNRFFGGRGVIRKRTGELLDQLQPGEPIRVLDIGSGAGDLCRELIHLCRERAHPILLVSVDAHAAIQAYARREMGREYPEARFVLSDARRLAFQERQFDLVLCTLALHHFTEEDAAAILREMRRVSRRWALVSDLVRSQTAYAAVWLVTRFTTNAMTRHDGPVSVERAFTPEELQDLASKAGWTGAKLIGEPWFRRSLLYTREAE